jgi:protein TonB
MFDETLIASRGQKRNWNQLATFPIALILHGVVLAGYLVAQIWQIEDIPEPPIQVSFYQMAPPPPPPPAPPKAAPAAVKPVVQQPVSAPVVQPVEIPDKLPEKPTTNAGEGVEGGVEGGIEGGVAGGIPGGVPAVEVEEPPIRIGGEVVAPEKISDVKPIYPDIARKARVQGVVIIEAIIDKNGTVTDARTLRGLPMGVSEAALDAVRKWKYRPATLNGRPVAVYLTVTVTFTLQ